MRTRRKMPRFLLARDLGIDLGTVTRPGLERLGLHLARYPAERQLLALILVVLVQSNAKDGAAAERALRSYLPGMFDGAAGGVSVGCGHPACPPEHCYVAEFESGEGEV